jgi:flagellar biosynthesis/type III secretory pathway M-ring protein FliF/YscJ
MSSNVQIIELSLVVLFAVTGVFVVTRALVMPAGHKEREAKREKQRRAKMEQDAENELNNQSA